MEKMDIKKVFIAGGTGFLGYYSALEFLNKGISVDTISIADIELGDWFPKDKIGVKYGNIFKMNEQELKSTFEGYDALVYAIGPDDRVHPPKGEIAYDFFKLRLIDSVKKVFNAAREAGVKKTVLLNSYFAYFAKNGFEQLPSRHPYIKVRLEQASACIECGKGGYANGGMDVVSLELPYIFGSMPGRMPLWKEVFLDRFAKMPAVYFPNGGTNMIHVSGIAEGIVAATLFGQHGRCLPIGGANKKYKFMINTMMESIGAKKRCVPLPTWVCTLGGAFIRNGLRKQKIDTGLDYKYLMPDIQSKDLYFDPTSSRKELCYDQLGYKIEEDPNDNKVKEGIVTTMKACYPHRFDEKGNLKSEWIGINPTKYEPLDNDPKLSKEEKKANKLKCLEAEKAKKH